MEHFSDGVLEGSHLAYPFHDASQTLFVQEHPVEQVGGDAGSLAGGNIFRIAAKISAAFSSRVRAMASRAAFLAGAAATIRAPAARRHFRPGGSGQRSFFCLLFGGDKQGAGEVPGQYVIEDRRSAPLQSATGICFSKAISTAWSLVTIPPVPTLEPLPPRCHRGRDRSPPPVR